MARTEQQRPPAGWSGFEAYLLDQVQAAVVATDVRGVVTHWNRHAEVLFRVEREEALGRPLRELLGDDAEPDRVEEIMELVRTGRSWEGELTFRRPDGTQVLCYVTESPVNDPGGKLLGTVSVAVDIAERKRAERRLEAQYAVTGILADSPSLADAAPRILEAVCRSLDWELGALWRVDELAGVLRCVDVWKAKDGAAPEFEAITRSRTFEPSIGLPGRVWSNQAPAWIPDVVPDPNFPRGPVAAKEGLHGAFGFPIEFGGNVLGVLEFFSDEIRQPDQDLLEMLGAVGSQIGQFVVRIETEEEVRRSEARKTAILRAALDCVVTIDHEGRIVEFNPAAEKVFGYRREEVIGHVMADLIIPPSLRGRHWESFRHYLRSGQARILGKRIELTGMRADGSEFPVEVTITRVDVPGPPVFTGYIRDITAQKQSEGELEQSRQRLRLALEAGNLGTWEYDVATGSVVWDETLEAIYGFPRGGFGGTFEDYAARLHPDDRRWVLETIRQARESGAGHEFEHRIVWPDGTVRWVWGKGSAIRDGSGRITGMTGVSADITERKQAEEAQQFLSEATQILAGSLDFRVTLAKVARVAVPRLADWCAIDIQEDDGTIRQLAVEHVDPSKVRLTKELGEKYPPDPKLPSGPAEVIRTGKPELYPEIPDELLVQAAQDEEHLRIIRALGLRSAMVVPLIARGRTMGAITLVSAESGRRFGPADMDFAQELARRAAFAVDNARLFEARSYVAHALQQSLLPPQLPDIPGLELARAYRPAGAGYEVGGDFYDVFPTGGNRWALVIGDVCGKGPDAAAVTGLARYTLRAAATLERRPSSVLKRLNDAILEQRADNVFCTVAFVRVRLSEAGARLTVCCAGHPLPLVLRSDGSVESVGRPGTLLGVFADPNLADRSLDLLPGDALVLYTDGVVEERGAQGPFAKERLISLLSSSAGLEASSITERIERALIEFQREPPRDDIALLALRVKQ